MSSPQILLNNIIFVIRFFFLIRIIIFQVFTGFAIERFIVSRDDDALELADTALALQAWERAKATFHRLKVHYEGMIMHHDQGSAFISHDWTSQLLLEDKVRLSYALRGAKDNPEMESFNGHFKNEAPSLFLDAQTLDELIVVVGERMRYYNTERRHSSIDYLAPLAYIRRLQPDLEIGC